MEEFQNIKLYTALISAIVAVSIFFLSQWFLSRRNAVENNSKKLEELYLEINEFGRLHTIRFELIRTIASGDSSVLDDPEYTMKLYLLDINKKILMLTRLYFPELIETHKELSRKNSEITKVIYKLLEGKDVIYEDLISLFGDLGTHFRLIEDEIIYNKSILVGENILPKKYKKFSCSSCQA